MLKIDVKAVSEADLLLAVEASWVDPEWVLDLASAFAQASDHSLPGLLTEFHALESLLYFFLLGSDLLEGVGLSSLVE